MTENFNEADHPRDNGTFTDKLQTSPEIPPLAEARMQELTAKFTIVTWGEHGDTVHGRYEDALRAADGDERRVFSAVDGDYPDGQKIFVFDNDGDTLVVTGETEGDARISAAVLARKGDEGVDDGDEEADEEAGDGYDLEGVYYDQDDIFDADSYERAPDSYAEPGRRTVNANGFIVTEERWEDDDITYVW